MQIGRRMVRASVKTGKFPVRESQGRHIDIYSSLPVGEKPSTDYRFCTSTRSTVRNLIFSEHASEASLLRPSLFLSGAGYLLGAPWLMYLVRRVTVRLPCVSF